MSLRTLFRSRKFSRSFKDEDEDLPENANAWSEMLPEILGDIIRRVEADENVVACACVCKSWRHITSEILKQKQAKKQAKEEQKQKCIIFLKSCDFIEVSTRWKEVQDWIMEHEKFSGLDKNDCFEIFKECLHILQKKFEEEEEERKKEEAEQEALEGRYRNNFRRMMNIDFAKGTLTANTHWFDYYSEMKNSSAYQDLRSNTLGSTGRDLFEYFRFNLPQEGSSLLSSLLSFGWF